MILGQGMVNPLHQVFYGFTDMLLVVKIGDNGLMHHCH